VADCPSIFGAFGSYALERDVIFITQAAAAAA